MGHIRERPEGSGTWQIIYDLPRSADGKRRQTSKTIHGTEKQAKKELVLIEQEINRGTYCEPTKENLAEYLDRWLQGYARPNVRRKTVQEYESIIKNYIVPELGHIPLQKFMPLHFVEYQSKMLARGRVRREGGLKPQTVKHHYRLLHSALNWAVEWKMIYENPMDRVKPPTVKPFKPCTLTVRGMAQLIKFAEGTDLYMPIVIALSTGMRRGEIVALKWEHVDFDSSTIYVDQKVEQVKEGLFFGPPKSDSSERSILMPDLLTDALRKHKIEQARLRLRIGPDYQDNGLVCPTIDGRVYPPGRLSTQFSSLIRKIGAENLGVSHLRFHDCRHSMATLLESHRISTKITSQRLGHADVAFTLRTYAHPSVEFQKEAAELIDGLLQDAIREVSSGT